MEFEYKVTVIIPVYNAEKNIDRTMSSLFQQTIAQDLVEIILIDDGSSDDSPCICDRYAEEHRNVRVIHQVNQGVSAARNAGIKSARGKYLLYLDSDDTISAETLLNIVNFFEQNYREIDIVTYPLQNNYEDGSAKFHWRYEKYLTKTGVYSLEKYPYIAQTTINVCVKNQTNNEGFDPQMVLVEDQLHNVKILSRLAKIGFVKEAQYNYFRTKYSSSAVKVSPYYSFDPYNIAYQQFLNIGNTNKLMQKYCESLVLYNVSWRLSSNILLPSHLAGEEYKEAVERFIAILNCIPNNSIMSYPHLDTAYKYYLLSLKTKDRPFVFCDSSGVKIVDGTGELRGEPELEIVVTQISAQPNGLYLLAYIKCFAFAFTEEEPQLFAVLPGAKREKISIFYSQFSSFWTKFDTNRFFAFHYTIPWTYSEKIKFEVSLQNRCFPVKILYAMKQKVHPYIGCSYLIERSHGALFDKAGVKVVSIKDVSIVQAKKTYEKTLFKTRRKLWLARRLMELFRNKRVWLYFDSHNSLDNGYYQFLHDIEKKDGIERYYVYHSDNPTLVEGKFPCKGKLLLVRFGSVQHKCLMAAAEKVLVAFADWSCYLPFDPNTYQYYSDLFHYDVIYLQHGVMHAQLPNMYSKEKVWQINQIVASTIFEKNNLLKLGYREEDILTCGMPRLDTLIQSDSSTKRILFAPSWRVSLVQTVDGVQTPIDSFYRSDYYREFSAFLKDGKLHNFLDENDLYLDVQIHPMFSCYADSFCQMGSTRISITRFANAADYLACVTDFSSFMFDFIYLDKPVISYFPDKMAFRAGSHSYNDFYYPLDDGFALYCEDKSTAIDMLRQLCEDNFSLPPKLAERAQDIYFKREATHREELYHILMGDK